MDGQHAIDLIRRARSQNALRRQIGECGRYAIKAGRGGNRQKSAVSISRRLTRRRRWRCQSNQREQARAEEKKEREKNTWIVKPGFTVVLHRMASGQRFKKAAVSAAVYL